MQSPPRHHDGLPPLDLREEWLGLLPRRPALVGSLAVYDAIVEGWAAADAQRPHFSGPHRNARSAGNGACPSSRRRRSRCRARRSRRCWARPWSARRAGRRGCAGATAIRGSVGPRGGRAGALVPLSHPLDGVSRPRPRTRRGGLPRLRLPEAHSRSVLRRMPGAPGRWGVGARALPVLRRPAGFFRRHRGRPAPPRLSRLRRRLDLRAARCPFCGNDRTKDLARLDPGGRGKRGIRSRSARRAGRT